MRRAAVVQAAVELIVRRVWVRARLEVRIRVMIGGHGG